MIRKSAFVLALACMVLTAAAAEQTDFAKSDVPADFKDFSESGKNWSIKMPANWKADAQNAVVIFMPEEQKIGDNVNIRYVEGVPANLLKQVADESIKAVTKMVPGLKVQSNEPAKFGDLDAYYLVYTGDFNGQKAQVGQVLIADKNTLYVITTTAKQDSWDNTWKTARQMIASFKPKAEK